MKTDVLIIGGGPGGSATAMFLAREGIKPIIVEAERFPRYHIGESMTGAGGKVLRDLNLSDEMYKRKHPTKQGVKVYGQSAKGTWFVRSEEHTSELQSQSNLVCRLLLEKKKKKIKSY